MTTDPAQSRALLDGLFAPSMLRVALHGIHDVGDPSRVIGYEALMRGPRGTPYESPPLAFAMAATLDLLEQLNCRCVEMASRIDSDGLLFVNVHPRTVVAQEAFWEAISRFGMPGERPRERVVFEIVEHSPAKESDLPRALMELRALGFRIAVDDLGEGASGLRRMVELAPDFAKIDRFFTSGIDGDVRRRAIVAALAESSRAVGSQVIAEGVERPGEHAVLRDLGIELAQGWLFGKPSEVDA